jgi:lipopolysaccharide biosynthesis regulator YciM
LLAELRDAYVAERRWSDALRTERALLPLLSHPDQAIAEQARLQGLRYEQALVAEGDGAVTRELRALVAESPHFLPAVVGLGDRLRAQGQHRDAGLVWTRAALLRPEPLLLSRIETVYRDVGRPEKVLAFYRRLRRRADTPILRLRHARWLLSLGKADEAAAELANPTPDIERHREFHAIHADIHRLRGNADLALGALGRALDREAATRRPYHCRACGRHASEWAARCPDCGAWDTLRPVADFAA